MLLILMSAFAAFLVTTLAIFALRPVAFAIDLVDRPGGRKTHHGVVPLVGGLAIFIGFAIAIGLMYPARPFADALMGVCGLMVLVGLFDDRFSLSPWARLPVHLMAAGILIGSTHVMVRTLGDPFGLGALDLPAWAAALFTMAMLTGAVNSFNMLDGMDGLAGLNAIASLGGLAALAWTSGSGDLDALLCLLLASAICGFLVFNAPLPFNRRFRCFMGDAGSTLIGISVGWLCAAISQMPLADGVAHPSYVLWMVALPLAELWYTFLRRTLSGHSPFHADAGHFHHLLLQGGLSVRGAFLVFLILNGAFVGAGLLLAHLQVPDSVAFFGLVASCLGLVLLMRRAEIIARALPRLRRIRVAAAIQ